MNPYEIQIDALNAEAMERAAARQNALAKPPKSLGVLEEISIRWAGITGGRIDGAKKRRVLIFASDNGVVAEGVASAPQSVTLAQTINFTRGLTGVAVLTVMSGGLAQSGGLMWLFLAALSLSAYNILQRRLARQYTAMQASTYSIFAGTLMLAVFSPGAFRELAAAPAAPFPN